MWNKAYLLTDRQKVVPASHSSPVQYLPLVDQIKQKQARVSSLILASQSKAFSRLYFKFLQTQNQQVSNLLAGLAAVDVDNLSTDHTSCSRGENRDLRHRQSLPDYGRERSMASSEGNCKTYNSLARCNSMEILATLCLPSQFQNTNDLM